jgi:hypothetical protein
MNAKILSKNKVQLMTIFACPTQDGQKTKKRFKKKEDFFDKNGNNIEHIEYKQGKINKWEKYKYNFKGKMIQKTWFNCRGWDKTKFKSFTNKYTYDNNGQLVTSSIPTIEFDSIGNKIETTFYLNKKIKTRRTYNSKGICIEILEYKSEKVVKCSTFDESAHLVSVYSYDTKGQSISHSLFEYDEQGNKTKVIQFNGTGNVLLIRKLKYDNNNNLLEDIEFYNTTKDLSIIIFDELEKECNESYRHLYTYNDHQLLIEHKMFLTKELIMIYEHEYQYYEK